MRNETIDIMKAFCIIGVVLLHAVFIYYGENTELSNTLRLVCVSGFFILSGYVIYGKIQNTKWMVGKIIRRTPMLVIFTLLFWGFNNYVVGVDGNQVLEIPLGNYILYNIGSGFILSVLWYIWMLNIGYVVLWAFEKYKFKRFYLLQIGALMCLTFIPLDYGGFNLFRWYGLFFISGYAWNYIKDKNTVSRVWIGFIIVSVFAVSRGALSYSGEAVNGGFVNILQPHIIKGKSDDYKVDFVNVTHSTIQCVFPVIHTKEGAFVYTLDFKFDNFPTIGNPPSYKKMREIGNKGVKLIVVDSLYSGSDRKTPSERIARDLLEDAFSVARGDKKSALFVTTFSSHIARLKSIVEFGKKTGREIIFMGRSMYKYITAAQKAHKNPLSQKVKLVKYRRQIHSLLKQIERNRGKYLVVCTGHQAEPGSIMDRIVKGETDFKFRAGDNVIFSSSVIPTPTTILGRDKMDKKLRSRGVRVQTDIHVSGHAGREDLRELLTIFKPKHIIPAHGSLQQETPMIELASEFGYKFGETSHLSSDGKVLKF